MLNLLGLWFQLSPPVEHGEDEAERDGGVCRETTNPPEGEVFLDIYTLGSKRAADSHLVQGRQMSRPLEAKLSEADKNTTA